MTKIKIFRGREFKVLKKKEFKNVVKGAKFINENELQEDSSNRNTEAFHIKLDVYHKFVAALEKNRIYSKKQLIGIFLGIYNDTYPNVRITLETGERYLGTLIRFLFNNKVLGIKLTVRENNNLKDYYPEHTANNDNIFFQLKEYVMIVDTEQKDLSQIKYQKIEKKQYIDLIQSLRESINKISEKIDMLEEAQKNESKN